MGLTSGSTKSTLRVDSVVLCVTYDGTGDVLAAGCSNGSILLIDTATSRVRESPLKVDSRVSTIDFAPCGNKVSSGGELT